MIILKIIKNNQSIYSGKVSKVYIRADNLGTIELQEGHSNAMYKIHGEVQYICENDRHSAELHDAVACITRNTVEIVE